MKKLLLSTLALAAFTFCAEAQTDMDDNDRVMNTTYRSVDRATNPDMDQLPVVETGLPSMNLPGMNTVSNYNAETAPLRQGYTRDVNATTTTRTYNTTTTSRGIDTEEPEDGLSDDLPFLDDEDSSQDKELFGDGEKRDAMERNNTDGVGRDDIGVRAVEGLENAAEATGEAVETGAEATKEAVEDIFDGDDDMNTNDPNK